MASKNNGDFGFEQKSGNILNCPSSGPSSTSRSENVAETAMSSMSMCTVKSSPCSSANVVDPFFSNGWDPLASLPQDVSFRGSMASNQSNDFSSYSIEVIGNQPIGSNSHLVHYPSDTNFSKVAPMLSCFGSGSFSNMISSFGLSENSQIVGAVSSPNYPSNDEYGTVKTSANMRTIAGVVVRRKGSDHSITEHKENQISDDENENEGPLPDEKKRKRRSECHAADTQSQFNNIQKSGTEQQKDNSHNPFECSKERDEMKQKTEQNPSGNARKVTTKHAKDRSHNGDAAKEDYIHVRARRGQATNSHSLAERVRREKISERMRFLQDLVPGCNKITGKAVMLDEIINYVQSLQRQVEFLSMKLATVNPDMHFDIERLLSKDILHSRGGGSAVLGFVPGISSSHPQLLASPQGTMQGEMMLNSEDILKATNSQFSSMAQISSLWDDELQSVVQMGFVPNAPPDNLGLHGRTKVEL